MTELPSRISSSVLCRDSVSVSDIRAPKLEAIRGTDVGLQTRELPTRRLALDGPRARAHPTIRGPRAFRTAPHHITPHRIAPSTRKRPVAPCSRGPAPISPWRSADFKSAAANLVNSGKLACHGLSLMYIWYLVMHQGCISMTNYRYIGMRSVRSCFCSNSPEYQ